MHVVVDAPLLAGTLVDVQGDIGRRYRERLTELVGDDRAYVMRTLTKLEVAAALRNKLLRAGSDPVLTEEHCDRAIRSMASWPFQRIELTQPMLVRVWEMRNNITPYDAMYVAATEQLMNEHDGNAILATADGRLANAPVLSVPVERFSPDDSGARD
ncbi:MAG: type II toxin-antitoxin system VapC family toxin [Ilumatobacter sp.]|uniref:type II toxin-antitoxin system VapC family toxin n=1 Tax=Ilumatobacter sp. TaxID=1967498 RepID=UPI003918A3A0